MSTYLMLVLVSLALSLVVRLAIRWANQPSGAYRPEFVERLMVPAAVLAVLDEGELQELIERVPRWKTWGWLYRIRQRRQS